MTTLLLVPTALERDELALPPVPGVDVALCGMGPVAAALGAAARLGDATVERCVLAGVAGTRRLAEAALGVVVVGTAVRNESVGCGHGRDFRPLGEMAPGREETAPDLVALAPPPGLRDRPVDAWCDGVAAPIVTGVVGTVAAASASPEEAAAWSARHPDVLVEEMEGHAVALACRERRVPLSIVRAVSNTAGERDGWDLAGALAALRSALPELLGARS